MDDSTGKSSEKQPDNKEPSNMEQSSKKPTSKEASRREVVKSEPANYYSGKAVDYIRFEFNQGDEEGAFSDFKKRKLLKTLGSAKFWIPTGFTNVKSRGSYELHPGKSGRLDAVCAISILSRLGFTDRYEGQVIIASRLLGTPISATQDLVEASQTSDELIFLEGWEEIDPDVPR